MRETASLAPNRCGGGGGVCRGRCGDSFPAEKDRQDEGERRGRVATKLSGRGNAANQKVRFVLNRGNIPGEYPAKCCPSLDYCGCRCQGAASSGNAGQASGLVESSWRRHFCSPFVGGLDSWPKYSQ